MALLKTGDKDEAGDSEHMMDSVNQRDPMVDSEDQNQKSNQERGAEDLNLKQNEY